MPYENLITGCEQIGLLQCRESKEEKANALTAEYAEVKRVTVSGSNVILNWPTNGVKLQSTTSLAPPIVWAPVTPTPTVVNGQNAVTNTLSGFAKIL